MSKYEEHWHMHFVPECFFDTVLLKAFLQTNKRLLHIKGCNNVVNLLRNRKKDLFGNFAVALIDKDKVALDYFKECEILRQEEKFVLWKHKKQLHFIIQIDPPVEKWIIEILHENGLRIENFGYPNDYRKIKKAIKEDIDSEEDGKLKRLVKAIIDTNCETVVHFRNIVLYLKERGYLVDINELKNV